MTHVTAGGFRFEITPSGRTVHAVLRCGACNATVACHATPTADGEFTPNLDELAASLGFARVSDGVAACGGGCRSRIANAGKS